MRFGQEKVLATTSEGHRKGQMPRFRKADFPAYELHRAVEGEDFNPAFPIAVVELLDKDMDSIVSDDAEWIREKRILRLLRDEPVCLETLQRPCFEDFAQGGANKARPPNVHQARTVAVLKKNANASVENAACTTACHPAPTRPKASNKSGRNGSRRRLDARLT